jgi:hypothetical protein
MRELSEFRELREFGEFRECGEFRELGRVMRVGEKPILDPGCWILDERRYERG